MLCYMFSLSVSLSLSLSLSLSFSLPLSFSLSPSLSPSLYFSLFYLEIIYERKFVIDQQIARHFIHYSECLSIPLPFHTTQIILLFLNSRISTNHDKWYGILDTQEILIPLDVPLVKNLFFNLCSRCKSSV